MPRFEIPIKMLPLTYWKWVAGVWHQRCYTTRPLTWRSAFPSPSSRHVGVSREIESSLSRDFFCPLLLVAMPTVDVNPIL